MPSVPTLVSGGISLGILAGFLSSVYYVLVAGLRWIGNLQLAVQSAEEARAADRRSCARCGRPLSRLRPGGEGRRIRCAHCSLNVCRRCSTRTSKTAFICYTCSKIREVQLQTGEWFYDQLRQRFFNPATVAAAANSSPENQDGEVRDFMESVVEGLVGGGLDNVCLRPITDHPQYVKFCEVYHDPLALTLARFSVALQMAIADKSLPDTDTPSVIHEELKELVKRLIKEAMTLPAFQVYSNGSVEKSVDGEAGELEKKSYEDILATAILNKVVERYQQEIGKLGWSTQTSLRDANGNLLGRNIRRRRRKYQILSSAAPELGSRVGHSSSDSECSLPNSCDDCWSESSRTDALSFTVEECIEEVVTRYNSEEEPDTELGQFLSGLKYKKRQRAPFPEFGMDIVDRRGSSSSAEEGDAEGDGDEEGGVHVSMEVVSPVDSWEENWLFQKRRLKMAGMHQSMPVPMLVPNPTEEHRVLIGDVDADETSDLSECSDSALEDLIDGFEHCAESSVHSESEHELENTDAEDEFLMKLYNNKKKTDEPIVEIKETGEVGLRNGDAGEANLDRPKSNEWKTNGNESLVTTAPNKQYNLAEARNNELMVPQVDSGEGSLEMQQDSEYTVAYDSPAQLTVPIHQSDSSTSNSLTECDVATNKDINSSDNGKSKQIITHESIENELLKDNDDADRENINVLATPPRPGTIAEREHMKWQQAAPLSNNPYSRENIERRQRDRMLLRRQTSSDTSVEFPELTGANEASVVHIDCSGRKPDHKQYGRDYYINASGDGTAKEVRRDSADSRADVSTTHVFDENKPQVSVRVEVEVGGGRWSGAQSPAAKSGVETRTHVSNVNNQQLLTTVSTSNDRDRQQVTTVSTWSSSHPPEDTDDDYIPLPSVKALAKQFASNDDTTQQQAQPAVNPVSNASKNKLEVQTSPIRQVHSLTARCISKEFREGLRASNRPTAYQIRPVEKAENSGNISDDSGTASPTPTGNQKLYNSIAFWEQMNMSR